MILAEDILIGMWLHGEHLDDLHYVDPKYFKYSNVVRDLKGGTPTSEIYAKYKDIRSELIQMTLGYSPAIYESTVKSLIDQQTRDSIKQTDDIEKVKELIALRDNYMTEPVQGYKDYAVSFAREMERKRKQELIKWDGIPDLQDLTLGIKRKELTAIAARPSVGKSAFALQIAYGAWKQGEKVLYFPLEMSALQTFGRILVKEGFISAKENQSGDIKDNDKYMLGVDMLNDIESSGRFLIYEGVGQIEAIERLIEEERPYLVVIDQLTQMKSQQRFKDIRSQFSYMTSSLKRIAMQQNVAIALLCQINRSADNIKPTMANLKESGSIEEDSDNVILMHRYRKGDPDISNFEAGIDWDNIRPMEFNLAKQRDGETGAFWVYFRPAKMTFYQVYEGGANG